MDKLGAERLQQFIVGGMSAKEREEFQEGLLAMEAWAAEEMNNALTEADNIDNLRDQVGEYIEEDEINLPEEETINRGIGVESAMTKYLETGVTPVDQEEETEEDKDRLRYGGSKPLFDDDM